MARNPEIKEDFFSFRPKEKAAWYQIYIGSTNFTGKLTCTESFNTYEKNRIKNIDGFNTIKTPDGKTLTEKLRGTEAGNAIDQLFKSVELDKARNNFKEDLDNLNQLIKGSKPPAINFSPEVAADYLIARKGESVDVINKQHNAAKAQLSDLFKDPVFIKNFQDSVPDGNTNTIQEQMLEAFDKINTEEVSKFEKALEENSKDLSIASKNEFERISYVARKYNESAFMKAEIDKLIAAEQAKKGEKGNDSISSDPTEVIAIFKNVKITDLQQFDTIQHGLISAFDRKISKVGNNLQMSLNRLYQSKDSIRLDGASFGQVAFAHDIYTFNFTNKDPKKAEKDARAFYEGLCVSAPDPKKIVIQINGEVKFKYDDKGVLEKGDLFSGKQQRLEYAHQISTKFAKETDKILKSTPAQMAASSAKLKAEMEYMRKKGAEIEAPEIPPTVPNVH
ncbi:MAG: hypothetical protein H0T84_03225 [Tatlockia sp.]|nr:hypothetical protein [Tatlockia sp.]